MDLWETREPNTSAGDDVDGILEVVRLLKEQLDVEVDPLSSTSLSKEKFSNTFSDLEGYVYRYVPSPKSRPRSQHGKNTHQHNTRVHYDSVFLIVMLVWEQLGFLYNKPDHWKPGANNGYDCATKFATKWTAQAFAPHILGISAEQYQVVDVVALAWSIHDALQKRAQPTDAKTGYFSWMGFSLQHFDSKVVGAMVAKLAFQYLPSLPFL